MYIQFSDEEKVVFKCIEGDHIINSDGIVIKLHSASGHSEGHQIMTVESKSSFLVFLADSCYIKDGMLRPIEVEQMKSYNTSLETISLINGLLKKKKDKKIKLFLSHDFEFKKNKSDSCKYMYGEVEKYEFM